MISELIPEEKRRINELEIKVSNLERGYATISYEDIQFSLDEMCGRLDMLDKLSMKESNKQRREDNVRRVSHLRSSHSHVQKSLINYLKRKGLPLPATKAPLIVSDPSCINHPQHGNNNDYGSTVVANPYGDSYDSQRNQLFQRGNTHKGEARESNSVDVEWADSNDSLSRSTNMINEYIDSGRQTLGELTNQRDRLKDVKGKVLDILSSLGVSNKTIKAIESRDSTDALIVAGGIVFICVLLLFIWYFVKRR